MSEGAARTRVLVLMYHSVAHGDGPTFMPPAAFQDQLNALEDSGYRVVSLRELARWRKGETELPRKTAVLTFDDALSDFAEAAAPPILVKGWSATVFVPTCWVGRNSEWRGADPSQRVLDWAAIRQLKSDGVEVGSHAETHSDLTKLSPEAARDELVNSRRRLEEELGEEVTLFAAPYGAVNARVRDEISNHYQLAAGVKLGRVDAESDPFDLPRVEMHYFRDLALWRDFLDGKAEAYFALRQVARSVRAGLVRSMAGM